MSGIGKLSCITINHFNTNKYRSDIINNFQYYNKKKIPKSGSHFFCYGIFNRINYPGIQYCQFHDGIDRRIKGRLAWK